MLQRCRLCVGLARAAVAYPVDSGSSIYSGYAGWFDGLISSDALCGAAHQAWRIPVAVLLRRGARLSVSARLRGLSPLECVATRCAAQNHAVSGSLERCIAVPAVIEVCRPQSRHSYKRGRLFSTAARRSLQPGQMKPSGQRRLNKKATQLASSENAFWNSESERALAIGVYVLATSPGRPHDTLHLEQP